jgi:hypothetical protein
MGRASREKGKRGERESAAELSSLLGVPARRGVQYHGGPDSPDVVIDAAIHVEAKRVESLQLYPAVKQATADAPDGKVPIVWHRRNNHNSVVIVETSRLVDLARAVMAAVENR